MNRFKDDDRLKDIITRLEYLEKMFGNRNSLTDRDPSDKLPLIRKTVKPREREGSLY